MPLAKKIRILKCEVRPLSQREMVFLDEKRKPESRAIHVATMQAFARGRDRVYVYFYKESETSRRYLEERTAFNYGGDKMITYEQVMDESEHFSIIEHLKGYLWDLYQKGRTIDVYGVKCEDPIPFFFDLETGKLDHSKETNTEKLLA